MTRLLIELSLPIVNWALTIKIKEDKCITKSDTWKMVKKMLSNHVLWDYGNINKEIWLAAGGIQKDFMEEVEFPLGLKR